MAAAGSASGSHRVQPIDADTAKVMVTEQTARVENLAMAVIAQCSAFEKTALRELRTKNPGITTDELVRIWIDRLTGRSPSDITDAVGDEVEEMATVASNKVTSYLQLLAQNESTAHPDNCLDCTFCGAWFPDFWLLDLMPQGSRLAAAVLPLLLPVRIGRETTTSIGARSIIHCFPRFTVNREQLSASDAPIMSTINDRLWPTSMRTTTSSRNPGSSR